MQLLKVEDKRDNLARARRKELERFAVDHNVSEVQPGMPAELIRMFLRRRGLVDIRVPHRVLGAEKPTIIPAKGKSVQRKSNDRTRAETRSERTGISLDADDDLFRQWQEGRFNTHPYAQEPIDEPAVAEQPAPRLPELTPAKKPAKPKPFVAPEHRARDAEKQRKRVAKAKGETGKGLAELHKLKRRLKEYGVPVARTDKMVDLKEKLANYLMTV